MLNNKSNKDSQLHHVMQLEIMEPWFRGLNSNESAILSDWLTERGYPTGDRPNNLIEMENSDHWDLHKFARNYGIELHKKDKRYKGYRDDESGKKVSGAGELYSKISRLPLQKRLELLPDWLEFGQGALNEEIDRLLTNRAKAKAKGVTYLSANQDNNEGSIQNAMRDAIDGNEKNLTINTGGGPVYLGKGINGNGKAKKR